MDAPSTDTDRRSRADLLLHPVRLRIVQTLVGRPMSPVKLRAELPDIAQATLYRHVNMLADGGLIEAFDEQRRRGGTERTYRVVETAVSLDADDVAALSDADHLRYFTTFVGTLLNDFGRFLASEQREAVGEVVGYRQYPVWLTDDEFETLVQRLQSLLREVVHNDQTGNRQRRLISTIVMPDRRSSPDLRK